MDEMDKAFLQRVWICVVPTKTFCVVENASGSRAVARLLGLTHAHGVPGTRQSLPPMKISREVRKVREVLKISAHPVTAYLTVFEQVSPHTDLTD